MIGMITISLIIMAPSVVRYQQIPQIEFSKCTFSCQLRNQ
ncbi:hypothetical protein T4A_10027 [Trichinella pseudospiralis]|uniref:Uncharacterized protein n=1 Tax=Trichinella pseudospiralis TaxID=6337 RepID=A0A0V1DL55_TRIPS|nr:hypothetical protein T4A_10027 [Trichinella pseudospiralis]